MNSTHLLLTMYVLASDKEELVDKAIASLEEYKASGCQSEELFNDAARDCFTVTMKHSHRDQPIDEVLSDARRTAKIATTAQELEQMMRDNDIDHES